VLVGGQECVGSAARMDYDLSQHQC
jgi:glycyl-tRNA synthetase (class II)